VLFIAGHVPAYRIGALRQLHEREQIELALFGGRSRHGGPAVPAAPPLPHSHVRAHELWPLAASGRYRAVICPTAGRLAPLAGWAGARRAGAPLVLWASLWAHPRTAAHAFTYLPLRRLYRSADAIVTYGPHVSAYVRARGARNVHIAPQSVDNDFWSAHVNETPRAPLWPAQAAVRFLFVGRPAREKGVDVLLDAWRSSGLAGSGAALVLVGGDRGGRRGEQDGVVSMGALDAAALRSVYAASEVLVVPSITTRTFREPWGLVINEAMNRGLTVIASDAVGAVAGGLVRDGDNGLVVPAGDVAALADALRRLGADAGLRARLGSRAREDVRAYSHEAWARGFSAALGSVCVTRERW
jgi:glycosyltransferase involved in cell wall biosynthesis